MNKTRLTARISFLAMILIVSANIVWFTASIFLDSIPSISSWNKNKLPLPAALPAYMSPGAQQSISTPLSEEAQKQLSAIERDKLRTYTDGLVTFFGKRIYQDHKHIITEVIYSYKELQDNLEDWLALSLRYSRFFGDAGFLGADRVEGVENLDTFLLKNKDMRIESVYQEIMRIPQEIKKAPGIQYPVKIYFKKPEGYQLSPEGKMYKVELLFWTTKAWIQFRKSFQVFNPPYRYNHPPRDCIADADSFQNPIRGDLPKNYKYRAILFIPSVNPETTQETRASANEKTE